MITKLINWFKLSNRYLHILIGIICGIVANSWYCVEYGAIGVSGALELKDKLWGGKADAIDFILTVIGFNIGYCIRILFLMIV